MPITPVNPIPALQWAKPRVSPYSLPGNVWCNQCRRYQPRDGHISVSDDGLRRRVLCASCKGRKGLTA